MDELETREEDTNLKIEETEKWVQRIENWLSRVDDSNQGSMNQTILLDRSLEQLSNEVQSYVFMGEVRGQRKIFRKLFFFLRTPQKIRC